MKNMRQMGQGRLVEVQLHGDLPVWYPGKVIKAKKMWVELDPKKYPGGQAIADENNIKRWRYRTRSTSNTGSPK